MGRVFDVAANMIYLFKANGKILALALAVEGERGRGGGYDTPSSRTSIMAILDVSTAASRFDVEVRGRERRSAERSVADRRGRLDIVCVDVDIPAMKLLSVTGVVCRMCCAVVGWWWLMFD